MSMSKRDYEMLAHELNHRKPRNPAVPPREYKAALKHRMVQWRADVEAIANALAMDNPKFDRNRFEIACGYKEMFFAYGIDQGEAL